ncbi:MAG TPA: hypothetical protein VK439_00455, partial [Rubrivivax sp.]|nr:hypothetical protein [Rubrivivax sp.]
ALGSGSRPTRERGFVVPLDAAGAVGEPPRTIDLTPLYSTLRRQLGELNIEGAFFTAGGVTLLQRGNRSDRCNASLRFEAGPFVDWICGRGEPPTATSITSFDLGDIDGVALSFTDGTALHGDSGDFWIFSAASEDTSDSYNDGVCLGSVIGVVDGRTGRVVQQARLATLCKVEGTALAGDGDHRQLLLVTDADDRCEPAKLLSCTLPAGADWL